MRRLSSLAWLGVTLLLLGCIPSLHPLYTEEDLIFDPALVGSWINEDTRESWTFTKTSEKQYKVVYVEPERGSAEFEGRLLKSGESVFLDLYPSDPKIEGNEFYKIHFVPVHTFMLIRQIEPELKMAALHIDWIRGYLRDNPAAVKHERVENDILFTAQPKELQAFLVSTIQTEKAWADIDPLKRKAEEKPE